MYISNKLYIYIVAVLISLVIVLSGGLYFLSVNSLVQAEGNRNYIFSIIALIVVFSFSALGLITFSVKIASRKPIEETHALLKRAKNGNGSVEHADNEGESGEIVVILGGMMDELYKLLQSVQLKARAINYRMDMLNEGIHQVAADQTNLFSLNAAIETVRLRQDGFSIISSEILSLVERTKRQTNEVREMGSQIRMEGNQFMDELERVIKRIDPNRIDAP
ncbi:MAG: methyl-accepting chemotaxis protein [Proteobacteria bacterium]|jgi:methyl-accepting chemotaxis protein|nr:methyl-accepting chemotaxis protein [Pseudomonadota bacterium]